MYCKVNVRIVNLNNQELKVVLFDIDPIKNDIIGEKKINKSSDLEFVFALSETGEFNPELQIKVFDNKDQVIYKSEINNEISGWSRDKVTGMFEKTTIDFNSIEIK
jgi:hypothetical protein